MKPIVLIGAVGSSRTSKAQHMRAVLMKRELRSGSEVSNERQHRICQLNDLPLGNVLSGAYAG